MTSVNNIRIAARIYDDIGDFQTADNLDNLIKLAGEKTFRPVDFLKALPLAVGIGTLGNVVSPSPTKPPVTEQRMMEKQNLQDQYGEDSEVIENKYVKPQAKPAQKQIEKPVQRRLRPAPKLKFEPVSKPEIKRPEVKSEPFKATNQPKGNFNETMKLMLNLEGGKTDEKSDRGGRTNFGITQRTYNDWLKQNKLKSSDVFKISKERALKIYRKQFWGVIKGDQLPHNVAKAIMSMALTDGPQDSVRFIQKLLNIEQTGFMGPKTLAAIWSKCKKDDKMFTKQILDAQIKRYKSDEQADTYGKGWTNRADLVAENID
jgi:hypothetical protein